MSGVSQAQAHNDEDEPADWRAKHIEEADEYQRAEAEHGIINQAAMIPLFAESLAEPRVLAVARGVLDQHIRVAQVEALGKSPQPGRRPHNNQRGWQCVSSPSPFIAASISECGSSRIFPSQF